MPKIRGIKPDYWTDEDVVELSIAARLLFIGLWSYACDNGHLQDKPKQIKMRVLPGDDVNATELLGELEAGGRITRADGWITIPKFAVHQRVDKRYFQTCEHPECDRPDGDSQPRSRRAPAESPTSAQRAPHESPTSAPSGPVVVSPGSHGDGDGDGDGDGESSRRQLTLADPPKRGDVERICQHLQDRIAGNGSRRPTITQGWRDAARLLLDKDERDEEQVHKAIDWCQDSEFWRGNILSLPKLREQYDQLRLHAQRGTSSSVTRRRPNDDIDWDAAAERAAARDQAREATS